MPNMHYCQFENTLLDLQEVYDSLDEEDLSEDEQGAREALIDLCVDIALGWGHKVSRNCEEVEA